MYDFILFIYAKQVKKHHEEILIKIQSIFLFHKLFANTWIDLRKSSFEVNCFPSL